MSNDRESGERQTEPVYAISVATPPGMPAIDGQGRPMLPGYQLLKKLGEGRMSVVWKAQLIGGFRPIAIKVLRPELMNDSAVVRAFVMEGKMLAELEADNGEHPHLVPVLDAGTFGHHLCILMKFMRHGDLAGWIAARYPATSRINDPLHFLDLATQVADGAAYLHINNIIHRDIKPENVFVDRHGGKTVFRLGDLGLAVDDEATHEAASGTPLYMAPEAFLRQPATTATDIYALGATFFTLLTGQPPYQHVTLAGLASLICTAPVPQVNKVNPQVPKALSDIIGMCLRKDQARRFADARALLKALQDCRTRLARGATPPPDASDDSTWCGEPVLPPS